MSPKPSPAVISPCARWGLPAVSACARSNDGLRPNGPRQRRSHAVQEERPPMPDKVEYEILKIPLMGRNLAASRVPALQAAVPQEWADILSGEVAAGDWSMFDGAPIHSSGQNIQQRLEAA